MDRDCLEKKIPDMFPEVQKVIRSSGFIDAGERCQYYYPIIMRYLKNKTKGWNIGDFLYELGVKKIALYAITELTELVVNDLERCNKPIELTTVCDRKWQKYLDGFHQQSVISIADLVNLYRAKKIEKIVICSVFHMNEIFEDLMERGIELEDIISVSSAIFNGKGENKSYSPNIL